MAIVGVGVRWKGYDYACLAVPDVKLGVKFKCGKCSRGVVPPFMGEKCLLCGAVVSIVDDRTRPRPRLIDREFIQRPMDGMGTAKKPEPADLEAIRARNERNKQQMAKDIAESGTAFMLSEPHPYHDITTLLAEVKRLLDVVQDQQNRICQLQEQSASVGPSGIDDPRAMGR